MSTSNEGLSRSFANHVTDDNRKDFKNLAAAWRKSSKDLTALRWEIADLFRSIFPKASERHWVNPDGSKARQYEIFEQIQNALKIEFPIQYEELVKYRNMSEIFRTAADRKHAQFVAYKELYGMVTKFPNLKSKVLKNLAAKDYEYWTQSNANDLKKKLDPSVVETETETSESESGTNGHDLEAKAITPKDDVAELIRIASAIANNRDDYEPFVDQISKAVLKLANEFLDPTNSESKELTKTK